MSIRYFIIVAFIVLGIILGLLISDTNIGIQIKRLLISSTVEAHTSRVIPVGKKDFNSYCPKVVTSETHTVSVTSPTEGSVVEPNSVLTIEVTSSKNYAYFFVNDVLIAMFGEGQSYTNGLYTFHTHWQVAHKRGATYKIKAAIFPTDYTDNGCVVDDVTIYTAK